MTDPWEALHSVAADRVSGASEIARAAARALAAFGPEELRGAVETLLRGQPTMAPLWRLATALLTGAGNAGAGSRFLDLLQQDRQAAESAAGVLPDRVLTISWSSLVAEAVRIRRPRLVLCMVSEPGGEGARTAASLRGAAGEVAVIEDRDAVEGLPADAVLTGADAVTPRAVVNKTRTRALAEAARSRSVPCWAVAGDTKFLAEALPLGEAFEPVPIELFTAVAVPGALLTPERARRRALARPVHPSLRSLLDELRGAGATGATPDRGPRPPDPS